MNIDAGDAPQTDDAETSEAVMDLPSVDSQSATDVHRVLVVANERIRGADLLEEIRRDMKDADTAVEVFVVAPSIADSRVHHEMGDFDTAAAGQRLAAIIRDLKEVGIVAMGHVGDGDPVTAVGDGLREFPADELIAISHPEDQQEYGELNMWERIKTDFKLPMSEIEVSRPAGEGQAPGAQRIEREPAKRQTEEDLIRENYNFPPLNRRDALSAVVALFGIFALGLIAMFANNSDVGPITGSGAVIIGIAIGAFLLNIGNVVGMLLFQSIPYTGLWERFLARLSLGFTTIGLVVALILWLA